MSKAKLTISIDAELAEYLRSTQSVSSTIAEAVEVYRARELGAALEEGYRNDADEAKKIHRQWSEVDAELDE